MYSLPESRPCRDLKDIRHDQKENRKGSKGFCQLHATEDHSKNSQPPMPLSLKENQKLGKDNSLCSYSRGSGRSLASLSFFHFKIQDLRLVAMNSLRAASLHDCLRAEP